MKKRTISQGQQFLMTNFKGQLAKNEMTEIFAFIFKTDYQTILKNPDWEMSRRKLRKFLRIVEQLKLGVPVAHLLKHKYFFQHDFFVNKKVLLPRMDSELLVETALEFLTKNYPASPAQVVDLGTGSGVIGLSIALARKEQDNYFLTDITNAALKITRKNRRYLALHPQKVHLIKADFLDVFQQGGRANLIVSNPPYIDLLDEDLDPKVALFEPAKALYANNDGLEFYHTMANHYSQVVDQTKPFMIIMEFGWKQKEAIEELFQHLPENHRIEFIKDNNSNWRAFKLYNK